MLKFLSYDFPNNYALKMGQIKLDSIQEVIEYWGLSSAQTVLSNRLRNLIYLSKSRRLRWKRHWSQRPSEECLHYSGQQSSREWYHLHLLRILVRNCEHTMAESSISGKCAPVRIRSWMCAQLYITCVMELHKHINVISPQLLHFYYH